jgi:hypothetical protein
VPLSIDADSSTIASNIHQPADRIVLKLGRKYVLRRHPVREPPQFIPLAHGSSSSWLWHLFFAMTDGEAVPLVLRA